MSNDNSDPSPAVPQPETTTVFLDWIDLEAARLLLGPRPPLSNTLMDDEPWWQAWKALRLRIENQRAVDPPPVVVTPDAINELKRLKPHVEKWKTADGREVRSRLANDLLTVIDARISALSEASGSGPERRADTQHQSTDDTVPCPACSGEGRAISDETCDECGGRGEVARAAEIAYQLGRLISHDNTPREHAALNAAIAHFELVGSHGTTPGIDARGSATDPSIEPSAEIDEARQLLLYRIRRSCAVPQDVDALIAAVLRSRDRQQEEERTDQARFDQSDQSTADLRGDDRDDTKP